MCREGSVSMTHPKMREGRGFTSNQLSHLIQNGSHHNIEFRNFHVLPATSLQLVLVFPMPFREHYKKW